MWFLFHFLADKKPKSIKMACQAIGEWFLSQVADNELKNLTVFCRKCGRKQTFNEVYVGDLMDQIIRAGKLFPVSEWLYLPKMLLGKRPKVHDDPMIFN